MGNDSFIPIIGIASKDIGSSLEAMFNIILKMTDGYDFYDIYTFLDEDIELKFIITNDKCVNKQDNDRDDLMQDFVSIITSFTARLYGLRRSKRKTEQLIKELEKQK